jgi:uncharacterized protein YraI
VLGDSTFAASTTGYPTVRRCAAGAADQIDRHERDDSVTIDERARRLTAPQRRVAAGESQGNSHVENRGVYGSRRVAAELRVCEGIAVPRTRVQRLTRTAGLSGLVARMR